MRLWSVLGVLAAAGPGVADATDLKHITFDRGEVAVWSASVSPRDHTPAHVADEVAPLALPTARPALPARGSTFSTLFRARDLFDLGRHPATTAAKLFQLKEDGERQGTACTAQFVGPRHLLTAAHCLVDRATGRPRPGFEIAVRHDGGSDQGVYRVVAAWGPASEFEPRPVVVQTTAPLDLAADCHDVALIAVDRPVEASGGWLGMSISVDPALPVHRFSYPHESSAAVIERLLTTQEHPDNVKDYMRLEIAKRRLSEPDFSSENLYYEYGVVEGVHAEALTERNGAVLPGRSGSAMIDGQGRVVAIMSRAAEGENYSCRLTPYLIGAFSDIAGLGRSD